MLRHELNVEMQKGEKDADKMTALDTDIRALYDEIMNLPEMAEFDRKKEQFDKLVQSITYILQQSAQGEDPMTCPSVAPSCTGSCSTCGGCG